VLSALLALLALPALLSLPAISLRAQEVPVGPTLLAWMGLEIGDTMAFEASDGARFCVTVGAPRQIGGRAFAPLDGLAWPGFASDSRILVPLDGALDFLVDWTPGPRPTAEAFLPPGGWSQTGADWSAAETLVYRWCEKCVDAGTTVVLEKDGGIRSISRQSIVGPTRLTRVEGGCAEREGVEFEIYIEPAPAREP
jgi:hypothetical protein